MKKKTGGRGGQNPFEQQCEMRSWDLWFKLPALHNRLEAHRRKMAGYRRACTQRHSRAKICVATCERLERGKAETALLCHLL